MISEIPLTFYSRRQNTNRGDDQYRIWAPREYANRLAEYIPGLAGSLSVNRTQTWPVSIRWLNGACPPLVFGTYADQAGELSFTALKSTYLFDYAAQRFNANLGHKPLQGTYVRRPMDTDYISLDVWIVGVGG